MVTSGGSERQCAFERNSELPSLLLLLPAEIRSDSDSDSNRDSDRSATKCFATEDPTGPFPTTIYEEVAVSVADVENDDEKGVCILFRLRVVARAVRILVVISNGRNIIVVRIHPCVRCSVWGSPLLDN
mmetsp:Transcript_2150/g.5722  ORF Transcript_2150/g.5722 Transcript_2150/m.5722 type:complete len:129 (+) Transcript_2150:353-739(+)